MMAIMKKIVIVLIILTTFMIGSLTLFLTLIDSLEFESNIEIPITDYSFVLGSEWETSSIAIDNADLIDLSRYRVNTRSLSNFIHDTDNPVFVVQHVYRYNENDHAYQMYESFNERVFVYNFGVPPSNQEFSYQDVNLLQNTNPNASKKRIACKEVFENTVLRNVQCGAFFLYGHYIVYIDAIIRRDFTDYVSLDQLIDIYSHIDSVFVSK